MHIYIVNSVADSIALVIRLMSIFHYLDYLRFGSCNLFGLIRYAPTIDRTMIDGYIEF